jgi:mannose-6-phosphate isomerase-like protein (cupin superfamily)
MIYHLTAAALAQQLPTPEGKHFVVGMQHGTMSVELYRPQGLDLQTPHQQDELYVIQSGSGTFFVSGQRMPFQTGDVLFVPAGAEHRFEAFTEDFATWVIFYGPAGGER